MKDLRVKVGRGGPRTKQRMILEYGKVGSNGNAGPFFREGLGAMSMKRGGYCEALVD